MSEDIQIFTDQPVEIDQQAFFGFSKYSKTLSKAIVDTLSPITFGIFGGWGTGKTSLMRMIYNQILESVENHSEQGKTKKNIFPVWFDAWRYENEPNLLVPLLYTMRDEIRLRYPQGQTNNPFVKLANFLDEFIVTIASGFELGLRTDFFGVAYKFKDSLEEARSKKKLKKEWLGPSSSFDMFVYLRKMITELKPIKIVIFVDDLDRCQPEKALQMLEYIKLVMCFEGIVFVVGADREILEKAVLTKFAESFHIDGPAFVKKMFQVIFTLPELREEDIQRYVEQLIADSQCVSEQSIGVVSKIIARGAGANPREIKRLVNSFTIMTNLESGKSLPEKRAMFLVLQQKWPTVYRRIVNKKELFLQLCEAIQKNQNSLNEIIKNGLDLESARALGIDQDLLTFFISIPNSLSFGNLEELNEYFRSASITSYQPLLMREFRFKHSSRKNSENDGSYDWELQPVASDTILDSIEKIHYHLPADAYPIDERIVTRNDHFITRGVGKINIPVKITIYFRSGEKIEYDHFLDLGIPIEKVGT